MYRLYTWVRNGFYSDEFFKKYLKSQVKDSLTFSFKPPHFKAPSKKFAGIAFAFLVIFGITLFTQQYRIKYFVGKYQGKSQEFASKGTNQPQVLAAQTSKLKL